MMKKHKQTIILLLALVFIFSMMFYTFHEKTIFWYLYAFTLLVGIAVSLVAAKFEDRIPTWQYLLYGIGYGTVTYGIVKLGYLSMGSTSTHEIAKFLKIYGPQNIFHYLLLIFIVAIGEEMFWRGYVQQQLKRFTSPLWAVFITALLFSLSLAISGFIPGAIAAIVVGLIWGALYEWKKSLPLIIVSHVVFTLLLFLVLPLV
ncbi:MULTISPECIES: CPBP family intramembrane glutamic endopeptidase [unclassified Lysinibacillus]|uniref:CPBP family intramembrane glutamic endopeptidase n=1 Tax=unclassified Lysinibacillus TaxID=2636778 RepID=UPI001F0EB382|nr:MULTISPECIES: CPBP family intramembrane glutamic endopeptidase [unclassified Lysinibacillus]